MNQSDLMIEMLERRQSRREERREFLRTAGSAAVAMGGVSLLAACGDGNNSQPQPAPTPPPTGGTPAPTPAPTISDVDVLNFALNLEYLEAQFYSYAAFGTPLENSLLTGSGNAGAVSGGRRANLTDSVVLRYAREIAADEIAHVRFLRQAIGSSVVSQPAIDIGSDPNGAFSAAARAAGLIGAGQSFDPYANDNNFLLGAFIFEDVGVTAYKGAAPLLTNKTFLEASAGILAAEAYHAGLIRTVLYGRGVETPQLRDATEAISNARDSLDGPTDLDQGVRPIGQASNIVPTDANGLAYSRSAGQVLNIVYLNKAAVGSGGFFPTGVNGNIKVSAASG